MQWAGEEYLLDELESEVPQLKKGGEVYGTEMLFWISYLYRHWHFSTGESSRDIYRQASAETMRRNYMMFHTLSTELAIENLKEIYRQKRERT